MDTPVFVFDIFFASGTITTSRDTVNEGESVRLCITLDPLEDATVELTVSTFSGTVIEGNCSRTFLIYSII